MAFLAVLYLMNDACLKLSLKWPQTRSDRVMPLFLCVRFAVIVGTYQVVSGSATSARQEDEGTTHMYRRARHTCPGSI